MSNRRCPKCGEEYSDTYRTCPFCEEEKAIRQGHPPHRQGGKRLEKQRAKGGGGAGGVLLLLTVVIIAGALAYVFFGDRIADTMGIRSDPAELGFTNDDETDTPPEDVTPPADTQPVSALVMSQPAMTLAAGETALLTTSGGAGEVSWSSSNENIATLEGGSVTGKAGGTVTITAAAGEESAACTVTITGDPWVSSAKLSLNKTDFTFGSSETLQLKVKGTDSPAVWSSANTAVATVSESGLVKWAGKGTTTVTATVDGQTLECIVRGK